MKQTNKTKIVIVGGGFGGAKLAHDLINKPGYDIKLISNITNFEYHGALYRTATGNSPSEVAIPLREIFANAKNVEVILDNITKINPQTKVVRGEDGEQYQYDYLVLALGNTINYFGLPDMEQKTYCISTVKQTIALRHQLVTRFKEPSQATIAIIGAGPTGVELAGEIANFASKVAEKYNKKIPSPKVILIEGADRPLPMFDPVLSGRVYKRLKNLGVELKLATKVNSCETGKVCLSSGDIDADIIVWTAGSKVSNFYEANDFFELERGKVVVDDKLKAKGVSDVFVIGDNALTQFSGMAQTALYDAKFLAYNFLLKSKGKPQLSYKPKKPIYVVPIGRSWAVYETDNHKLSGYQAWLLRRRADLEIFKNFEPYKKAVKRWRKANRAANF